MGEKLWRVSYRICDSGHYAGLNNGYNRGKTIDIEAKTQSEATRIAIWRVFKTAEAKYDFILDYDLAGKEPFIQAQQGDEIYYIDSFFAIPQN